MQHITLDSLKGKTAVITGGGGVIGKALVQALAAAGIKTAIADIKQEIADTAVAEISKGTDTQLMGVEANVLDKSSLENAKKKINDELGQIDFLINGAGGNSPKATTGIERMSPDDISDLSSTFFGLELEGFQKVFDLNFNGTLLPTMVMAEDMLKSGGGAVLNISSMNAFKPLTKIPAYSAAKASINNFTEWLAVHLAKCNIRVNAIAPGFFLTHQNKFLLTDEKTGDLTPRGQKIIDGTPMNRFGEVEELQGTMLYLLSDMSRFVTGIVIPVDGGFNAYSGV